ncbi:MAG: hypothetical protein AAF686_09590, partial [Pseudomonadota bacterium]
RLTTLPILERLRLPLFRERDFDDLITWFLALLLVPEDPDTSILALGGIVLMAWQRAGFGFAVPRSTLFLH